MGSRNPKARQVPLNRGFRDQDDTHTLRPVMGLWDGAQDFGFGTLGDVACGRWIVRKLHEIGAPTYKGAKSDFVNQRNWEFAVNYQV